MVREGEAMILAFPQNQAATCGHECDLGSWLADAIRTGQTACEIQIAEPEIAET